MLVAAPLLESKVAKNKRNTLAYLGYRSLVEEDKTLDILQGVLVIVAWAHKSCVDNSQAVNLTYLALGYAHNLGITQEPALHNNNAEISDSAERAPQDKTHLLEEQRTLLGLYCALSIISTRQSRRNPLDTPYIETCLKNIGQSQAETSDFIAAHIVRLVRMSERLSEGFGEPHKRTLSRPYAFLLEGTGRHFHTDLNRLAASAIYPSLASHSQTFELHRLYLMVRMYEPAIVVACHPDEGVLQFVFLLICLRNCLDAMRSFFDLFLELPVDLVLRYSIITLDHVIFVMLQAIRLLLVEIPDWDVQSAREKLDLGAVLNQIVARYEEADVLREEAVRRFGNSTQTEQDSDEMSSLSKLAREIRWLKHWFEARTQGQRTGDALPIELGRGEYQDRLRPKWSVGLLEDIDWNIG
ncbi:uncharacterized protein FTOL_03438 [Fusarium torulosum]|uniref:Uncharacterized protein n=1 Tax=Fusarium torulosum TaxID=33205 RepID=A0AAE8SF81_9HYPO|nr:uncharacterized protein FTOL_03438 [Fusarium torulosum]